MVAGCRNCSRCPPMGSLAFPMLRCPACHWLNPDSDRRCRRCGCFLRCRPLPSWDSLPVVRPSSRKGKPNHPLRLAIRWDCVLAASAILSVLLGLGQLSWHWVEPLLQDPPPPGDSPQALGR